MNEQNSYLSRKQVHFSEESLIQHTDYHRIFSPEMLEGQESDTFERDRMLQKLTPGSEQALVWAMLVLLALLFKFLCLAVANFNRSNGLVIGLLQLHWTITNILA